MVRLAMMLILSQAHRRSVDLARLQQLLMLLRQVVLTTNQLNQLSSMLLKTMKHKTAQFFLKIINALFLETMAIFNQSVYGVVKRIHLLFMERSLFQSSQSMALLFLLKEKQTSEHSLKNTMFSLLIQSLSMLRSYIFNQQLL